MYLIQNDFSKEVYIGYTNDIKRRVRDHNSAGEKFTTRNRGIWRLVYMEVYRAARDARARELRLKSHGSGKHELMKRLKASTL